MAEKVSLTRGHLIAIALATVGVNFLTGRFLGYPFLYCLGSPLLSPLYMAGGLMILYLTAGYTLYQLFRGNMLMAFASGMAFFAVIELPRLAAYIVNVGGSCE